MDNQYINEIIVNVYLNKMYIVILVFIVIVCIFFSIPALLYLLTIVLFIAGLMYLYNTYWKPNKTTSSTTGYTPESIANKKEVFYIANNIFSYTDAPKACAAYDSKLATYDDLAAAYATGANWCSYGWTAGQNVFFPTQQSTIDKLSGSPGQEHSCGHVGINGGYIEDASQKFGVNCYGVKPKPTLDEVTLMNSMAIPNPSYISQTSTTDPIIDSIDKKNWVLFPFDNSRWTKYIRV